MVLLKLIDFIFDIIIICFGVTGFFDFLLVTIGEFWTAVIAIIFIFVLTILTIQTIRDIICRIKNNRIYTNTIDDEYIEIRVSRKPKKK